MKTAMKSAVMKSSKMAAIKSTAAASSSSKKMVKAIPMKSAMKSDKKSPGASESVCFEDVDSLSGDDMDEDMLASDLARPSDDEDSDHGPTSTSAPKKSRASTSILSDLSGLSPSLELRTLALGLVPKDSRARLLLSHPSVNITTIPDLSVAKFKYIEGAEELRGVEKGHLEILMQSAKDARSSAVVDASKFGRYFGSTFKGEVVAALPAKLAAGSAGGFRLEDLHTAGKAACPGELVRNVVKALRHQEILTEGEAWDVFHLIFAAHERRGLPLLTIGDIISDSLVSESNNSPGLFGLGGNFVRSLGLRLTVAGSTNSNPGSRPIPHNPRIRGQPTFTPGGGQEKPCYDKLLKNECRRNSCHFFHGPWTSEQIAEFRGKWPNRKMYGVPDPIGTTAPAAAKDAVIKDNKGGVVQ